MATQPFYPGQRDYMDRLNELHQRNIAAWTGESSDTRTVGTGQLTLNVGENGLYAPGQSIIVTATANPLGAIMRGTVLSYVGGTLTANISDVTGSGSYSAWVVSLAGPRGERGQAGVTTFLSMTAMNASLDWPPGVIAWVTSINRWFRKVGFAGQGEWVESPVQPAFVPADAGTLLTAKEVMPNALFALVDRDGKIVARIDQEGRLILLDDSLSVQDHLAQAENHIADLRGIIGHNNPDGGNDLFHFADSTGLRLARVAADGRWYFLDDTVALQDHLKQIHERLDLLRDDTDSLTRTNQKPALLFQFSDDNGAQVAHVDDKGHWYLLDDDESVQQRFARIEADIAALRDSSGGGGSGDSAGDLMVHTNETAPALLQFADRDGARLAWVDNKGKWYFLNATESLQDQLTRHEMALANGGGGGGGGPVDPSALIRSTNGVLDPAYAFEIMGEGGQRYVLAYFRTDGALQLPGMAKPVQETITNLDLAISEQARVAGGAGWLKCYLDMAKHSRRTPIRFDIQIAPHMQDTAVQRIASMVALPNNRILLIWQQLNREVITSDESGVRLVQTIVTYNLQNQTMTFTPRRVVYEPPRWREGIGAGVHPMTVRLPSGRIICLMNTKKPHIEATTTGNNDISMIYSDNEGTTWSAPVIVINIDNPLPNGARTSTINLGTSGTIQRIPEGPYAGRLVCTWYDEGNRLGTLMSDDDGMTWRIGWQYSGGVYVTEGAVCWHPEDGSLWMGFRCDMSWVHPHYFTGRSFDGGQTVQWHGENFGWPSNNNNKSGIQSAQSSAERYSKIITASTDGGTWVRRDMFVRVSYDGGETYAIEWKPFPAGTDTGYSNLCALGNDVYALAWEGGTMNESNTIELTIFNMAEVFKNGNNTQV